MVIVTVGIDLAKNAFAVPGVDETGQPALVRLNVARGKLLELIISLPPCVIGMEVCSDAHYWTRPFAARGHTVRLIAPKFVASCPRFGVAWRERPYPIRQRGARKWCLNAEAWRHGSATSSVQQTLCSMPQVAA